MFSLHRIRCIETSSCIIHLRAPAGLSQKAVEALRGKCLTKAVE